MTRQGTLAYELLQGDSADACLLDLVDHLLDKGCILTGEVVLGLADIDLIYVELSALLCPVDRLTEAKE